MQGKQFFKRLKKQLPKNYAKLVSDKTEGGATIAQVHNVFNLRNKNEELVLKVITAAKEVAADHARIKEQISNEMLTVK